MLNITYNGVTIKSVKKPVKYKSLSIPEPLFKEIKKQVQNNSEYRNMAEYLREALREKIALITFYESLNEGLAKSGDLQKNLPFPKNSPYKYSQTQSINDRLTKIEKTLEEILKKIK